MIELTSASENAQVREAVQAASDPSLHSPMTVRLILEADGEDLSAQLEQAEWGQTAAPITLAAQMSNNLPARLQYARTRLTAEVNGAYVPQLAGEKTLFVPSDDAYTTDLVTSSAASLATGDDAVKFRSFTTYLGRSPRDVVWDVVRRLPYEHSCVSIDDVEGVVINWDGHTNTPGFKPEEPVGGALNRLSENQSVGYTYADTGKGGFRAWVPIPLSASTAQGNDPNSPIYPSHWLPGWQIQKPQAPSLRYAAVRVFHEGRDGRLAWEAVEEVPYRDGDQKPHPDRVLDIPSTDASEDGLSNGRAQAAVRAMDLARGIAHGQDLAMPTYLPLIERGDTFRVADRYKDADGHWNVLWLLRVEGYRHVLGTEGGGTGDIGALPTSLLTYVDYTACMLAQERIIAPSLVLPPRKGGIYEPERPNFYVDNDDLGWHERHNWYVSVQGDDLVFTDNSTFVAVQGDDLIAQY